MTNTVIQETTQEQPRRGRPAATSQQIAEQDTHQFRPPVGSKIREVDRETRIPMYQQGALDLSSRHARHGYKTRFFNDVGKRIENALLAGWEFVNDPSFAVPCQERVQSPSRFGDGVVRTVDGSNGMVSYLMQTPEEWWKEDQEGKRQKRFQRREQLTRNQKTEIAKSSADITPHGNIDITNGGQRIINK